MLLSLLLVLWLANLLLENLLSRGLCYHYVKAVHWVAVLLCAIFCITSSGPCSMNVVQNPAKCDACGPYKENFIVDYKGDFSGDIDPGIVSGNVVGQLSAKSICTNSKLFCFPSTLSGLIPEENIAESTGQMDSQIEFGDRVAASSTQGESNLSWASNFENFKLLNGGVVSCSMGVHEGSLAVPCCQTKPRDQDGISSCKGTVLDRKLPGNKNFAKIKSGISDGSSALHVEVSPPQLDWGQQYLYFPSLAFLTVTNMHSEDVMQVYEPYSTSTQFYPCNFSEMTLGPGEVASVCFVFLPTRLGLNSAHVILQTGFGGFLIQIRGFAVESPYGLQPLIDLAGSSSGRLRKNVSLFNPFDETLNIEEVAAWITFSSGTTSHLTKVSCSLNNWDGYAESRIPGVQKWFDVKKDQVDTPDMAVRLHRKWEIAPRSAETIIEFDFNHSQGDIYGAFCMRLMRSSIGKEDILMVPIEVERGTESAYDGLSNSVSVSCELLMPCEDSGTVLVALSLKSATPSLLKVVKVSAIGEAADIFQFKYVEGLIIFPGTTTQVAVVTYNPIVSQLPDKVPTMSMNCKLMILTNDSGNPQIKIPCNDIISICSRQELDSFVGSEQHPENVDNEITKTGSADSGLQSHSHINIKALEMAEADELVLQSWRSQGNTRGMSVLDSQEVLFPVVEIGTHQPKWINVKNPSHQPVVMQLILNSGEIVDECQEPNELLHPSSSSSLVHNKDTTPTRYGFSISENAVTEAYVHPHGRATFGPIFFHPSSRCWWKSSALIRNNLSGVEWLSLRGFGGSLALGLFEGSEPVQTIEFKLNLSRSLNSSTTDILGIMENNSNACSQPRLKELYARNTGDLPVEVSKIEISGRGCGLDGFLVHTCKGFALEPGESTKIIISHQTDFSAVMQQRDLQLALASGILVIPMKASLPISMLKFCRRSVLWMRVKKSWVPIIFVTSVMFLLFYHILPQVISLRSQVIIWRSGKCSIATLSHQGKSSRLHRNQKDSGKFAMTAKKNVFSRPIDDASLMSESVDRTSGCQPVILEHEGTTAEPINSTTSPPSLLSKSVAVETHILQEATPPGKLTIKVGKEKCKRRRKKKGSGAGLAGQFEVSSSQSGNSTPSSPLSPVTTSVTPKRSWPLSLDSDQRPEVRNPFSHIADRRPEKLSGTEIHSRGNVLEPISSLKFGSYRLSSPARERPLTLKQKAKATAVLLSSATFPSTGKSAPNLVATSPFLASTSPIAPHARAPGSKLGDSTAAGELDKKGKEDDFRYDIWGDHLFGLHLTGRSGEVYAKSRFAKNYDSDSFFLSGPQVPSVRSSQEG